MLVRVLRGSCVVEHFLTMPRDAFTTTSDFIISPHSGAKGLYVATCGSFHGYKFFPVLGKYITQMLNGEVELGSRKTRARGESGLAAVGDEGLDGCTGEAVELVQSATEASCPRVLLRDHDGLCTIIQGLPCVSYD
jgi:hypothetical protein